MPIFRRQSIFAIMLGALVCLSCFAASSAHAGTEEAILDALESRRWERAYRLAQQGGNRFTRDLASWYYLTYHSVIAPYQTYDRFLQRHPDWPKQDMLRERMEIAFLNSRPDDETLKRWFINYEPINSRAIILLLHAHGRLTMPHLETLWIEANLAPHEEAEIRSHYGEQLTEAMHEKRVDRLIWNRRYSAAKRMFPYLSADHRTLATARIALMQDSAGVDRLVAAVPDALKNHPGLLFGRLVFRARRSRYGGVEEMLLRAPAHLPEAKQWWPYQKRVIRNAIEDQRYQVAAKLLRHHSQIVALPRVEAEWLRGWLHIAYLDRPDLAATAFMNLYQTASLPISRSRGSYWTARAYEAMGKDEQARVWYGKSALFPTTFYGQLAHQQLRGEAPLPMPPFTRLTPAEIDQFIADHELAEELQRYGEMGYEDLLWPLIAHHLEQARSPGIYAGFAATARRHGSVRLAVKVARQALYQGMYLPELYPRVSIQGGLAIEPAFALAIARQESRFDHRARSSADARGLMQLLPRTALRVARSHNIPYSTARLYQPRFNLILGSHYMEGLLERFNGYRIPAIAGYNAGPSRSDQWQERFGRINGRDWRRNIQWIETIPFAETRNYVQRVLENYHVYRHLLSDGKAGLQAREALLGRR